MKHRKDDARLLMLAEYINRTGMRTQAVADKIGVFPAGLKAAGQLSKAARMNLKSVREILALAQEIVKEG
ncbi:MAG: hypothetical protein NT147_03095 [Candidatus Aminicenantes bacterium]|nr:hypothetical protein [Candidatus Aminicenantes bacterium]